MRNKLQEKGRRLEQRRERLEQDEKAYLREAGWVYSCGHPGSLWLWRRQYQGVTLAVPTSTALHMQAHFNSGVYKPDPE